MDLGDLTAALLLPLPPWVGFWIFRKKGRVGLSYGYFLGGILAALALPWTSLTGHPVPTALLGAALFGFTLFLQAQREGVQGLRRLGIGVGGASLFEILLLMELGLPWQSIPRFWAGAVLEALLWLLLADLAFRLLRGRLLELRMPLVGAGAMGLGALAQMVLPPDTPRLPWPAALVGGLLLGLVALQQLRWLRHQGAWVEGRGQGIRLALALLDRSRSTEAPGLAFGLEPQQAQWLVDEKGRVLESNGPFSRLVGLPRHRLRGYAMNALFQGGETPVWETLRGQLLKLGRGTAQATQVSEDGAFRDVRLEATAFDRGMALVWIADPAPGTLALRAEGQVARQPLAGEEAQRQALNALATLLPSAEQIMAWTPPGPAREAAERVLAAARRLGPEAPADPLDTPLDGPAALGILEPYLQKILPTGMPLSMQVSDLSLAVAAGALKRIATMLLLHAAEHRKGGLHLSIQTVDLGGRAWGLLQVRPEDPESRMPRDMLGLGWLRAAVSEARGMLELEQDLRGGLHPKIYLPSAAVAQAMPERPLDGRKIWVVDRDALLRDTLASLLRQWGGEPSTFEDLAALLRESRGAEQADVLVLERTPQLDRFQKALRRFQREPIPTLVVGDGQALPLNPSSLGLRRLGFVEKPLPGREFIHALLALVQSHE